jgi:succinoglycan biosynthesis transport protein ExoP
MAYEIALPEDDSRTFGDYLDALKRRRKPAIIIAASLLLAGLLGIFFWPNAYTSTAVILIEDPEVPPGLVPTTVTTFAARQVQYINQRVMTRTNLANIIEKFELFPEERKYLPTLLLVPDVEKQMSIDIIDVQQPNAAGQQVSSTIAFKLGFEHDNPQIARQVANEMVSLYLAENVRARTEQTAQTSEFMQDEVNRLDTEVKELEQQIATLKATNEGALPELMQFNMQSISAIDNEILEIDRQIQSLTENKILLDAELAKLSPMATTVLPDGRAVVAPEEQLKALQTQLAMMEGRYSADHPDVQRVRRDLAAVQAQLGTDLDLADNSANLGDARTELAKARERYAPDHPEVLALERKVAALEARAGAPRGRNAGSLKADNPVFIQIRAQRETLETQERSLIAKQAELRSRRTEFERRTMKSSDVEKDLSGLYRRLNTASASYQAARERLFAAKMGQALETQSKGERFTLVEPPDLPLQPSSPNRPVLLALLIVLVLAAGLGWPQLAESMDESVTSARALERVQGAPPIAEIPVIETEEDRRHDSRVKLTALVIAPVLVVVALLLVHFLFIPLDVLWYVALRRLGM